MSALTLIETATALVADDKGLLAMDESNPTCNKRFAALGIPGLACLNQETVDEVADATVKCLLRTVPAAVPGIATLDRLP